MEDNTKNNDVVEENNIESNEENTKVEETVVENNDSTVSEVIDEKPTVKKNNATVIVLAVICLALLGYLIFTKVGTSKTYKLSTLYQTYFGEVDGEMTLPKNWLYTEEGNFFKKDGDKLTIAGQISAAELSEDEYTSYIDSFSSYYEVNEVEGNDVKVHSIHTEQSENIYDVYFFYKDTTLVQINMLNATEDEINTVVNSLSY